MTRFGRIGMAAAIAALCFAGLAACGGGGGGSTPTEPTAIYGGAATEGDVYVIKIDYPAAGQATGYRYGAGGALIDEEVVSYAIAGNKYTFTDAEGNSFTGYLIPDTMLVMQAPGSDVQDIVVAVKVDTTVKTTEQLNAILDNKAFILTQFRHDAKGVKWAWSNVAADGAITGHKGNAIDDGSAELNEAPLDIDNFVYDATASSFTATLTDLEDGEQQTWTLYYTSTGLGVIDRGFQKGIRINSPKGTSTNPADYGIAVGDVYNTFFYAQPGEGNPAQVTEGTITVTDLPADNMSFVVTVDNGIDPPMPNVAIQAAATEAWLGFYAIGGDTTKVVQPLVQGALVFAGKNGDWQYQYGIGVKQ